MPDTTIKVDSAVRDRLALIAAEQGLTIRALVSQLAERTPTHKEREERQAAAAAYVREHLSPDFGPEDLAAGEKFWADLRAGRLPGQVPDVGTEPGPRPGQVA